MEGKKQAGKERKKRMGKCNNRENLASLTEVGFIISIRIQEE